MNDYTLYTLDKYNVTIKASIKDLLEKDKDNFSIKSVNKLYNMVISHFYELYEFNAEKDIKEISKILQSQLKIKGNDKITEAAKKIFEYQNISHRDHEKESGEKNAVLPIKITEDARQVVALMNSNEDIVKPKKGKVKAISDFSQSGNKANTKSFTEFLRKLFYYYASFPSYQREKILFSEVLEVFESAIAHNNVVLVKGVSTKNKPAPDSFLFHPFGIGTTNNEQNAYVFGIKEVETDIARKYSLFSMRLSKFDVNNGYYVFERNIKQSFDTEYLIQNNDVENIEFHAKHLKDYVDLARTVGFKYAQEDNAYYFDTVTLKATKYDKLVEQYGEDVLDVAFTEDLITSDIGIACKLFAMSQHDANFAYDVKDTMHITVTFEDGRRDYKRVINNRPETILYEDGDTVTFETTYNQAKFYFRKMKGIHVVEPVNLKTYLMNWHTELSEYYSK